MLDPIKIVLRSAPARVEVHELPPKVREYVQAQEVWCREAEKAVRALVNAVNVLQSRLGDNKTGTAWT